MALHQWTKSLESDAPLLRHYGSVSDLGPLHLNLCAFHDFQLRLKFASFAPPARKSERWKEDNYVGVLIELIGDCCQRFNVSEMRYDSEAEILTSECTVQSIQQSESGWNESDYTGVRIELIQEGSTVMEADATTLRLVSVSPISTEEIDRYTDPNKYA